MKLKWWVWLLIAMASLLLLLIGFWPWLTNDSDSPPETLQEEVVAPTSEPPTPEPEVTLEPLVELHNVPDGATFDPETRTFSWQTQPGDAGIYIGVCFRVTDPGGLYDEECINIYVLENNQAPTLSAIPLKHVEHGGVITFTLQAEDPDGDELSYFARNLPAGAIFENGTFTWLTEEPGVWPGLVFGVTDGKEKATQDAIIAVR